MTKMLYHDDPAWYSKPGQDVEIPLGAAVSASRHTVPALPWLADRWAQIEPDHEAGLYGERRETDQASASPYSKRSA